MNDNQLNINVLYVDDEPINLELFRISFRKVFNIFTAESGDRGLEVLMTSNEINAVISDMKMPNMTGIEFIKKASEQKNNIKFFLLSGYSITDEVLESIRTGLITEYFQKPYAKLHVIESIKKSLHI